MIPTPWIKAYDPAQEYLGGFSQGAQLQEANARIAEASQHLQAQQQEAQMHHELEQKRLEQNSRLEQQQLEISKAYHDAQVGMQMQRLEEAKKVNEWKMQKFAQQAQVQMQARQRIASGEDPTKVWMELGPEMGFTGSGQASISRAAQAKIPPTLQTQQEGGQTYYQSGQRPWIHVPNQRAPAPGSLTQQQRAQLTIFKDQQKALRAQLPDYMLGAMNMSDQEVQEELKKDPEHGKSLMQRRDAGRKIQSQIDAIEKQKQGILGTAPKATGQYPPAPPKEQREANETYMTPKGPHTWTGSGWVKPNLEEPKLNVQDEEEPTASEEGEPVEEEEEVNA